MSLKDELNQATTNAQIAQRQKVAFDAIKRNEAEEMKLKIAREQGQRIIDTLKDRLFDAANNGKKSYVLSESDMFGDNPKVVRINISYGVTGNADLMLDKKSLPIHFRNGVFNNNNVLDNNMKYYFVIEHIVTHLGLDCVLKFNHDGVGENSWHELVINW